MTVEQSDEQPKTRTITLTDRAPVKIREDLWPVIASAHDGSYTGNDYARRQQASSQGELDEYYLTVRQHADGRTLVYARLDAAKAWTGSEHRVEGDLLDALALDGPHRSERIARAIRDVGERCGLPDRVIRECIADLPADEI